MTELEKLVAKTVALPIENIERQDHGDRFEITVKGGERIVFRKSLSGFSVRVSVDVYTADNAGTVWYLDTVKNDDLKASAEAWERLNRKWSSHHDEQRERAQAAAQALLPFLED